MINIWCSIYTYFYVECTLIILAVLHCETHYKPTYIKVSYIPDARYFFEINKKINKIINILHIEIVMDSYSFKLLLGYIEVFTIYDCILLHYMHYLLSNHGNEFLTSQLS